MPVSAVGFDQGPQALVLFIACGAAVKVGPHAGDRLVSIGSGELELDISVELLEALLAAEFGSGGAEQAPQRRI
jgi:hypothetical protein